MNRISSGSGDKIVLAEQVVSKTAKEKSITKNLIKQKMVEKCSDKNNAGYLGEKQRELCVKYSKDFYEICKYNEVSNSNNAYSCLDADQSDFLSIKKCRITESSILDPLKDDSNSLQECHNEGIIFKTETYEDETAGDILDDLSYPTNFFTTTIESKLSTDKEFKEYEKQLQCYQRTLNVAHNVKKNAIRKQMLAKAFMLKLLEVENQCNIELLRIKQNLQCLEPLKMIAESWKTEKRDIDLSEYDLSPLYPDILLNTATDTISSKESQEKQTTADQRINENITKHESEIYVLPN